MKLVILSDTHNHEPKIPSGDVLIHCGDLTYHGKITESIKALDFIASRGHHHKIVIAGNHELGWQSEAVRKWLFQRYPSIIYLHDDGVTINGVKFWGSPVQPEFHGWAFQKQRGEELKKHWEQIPEDTQVLITHGPPKGYGDCNEHDERFGDEDLLERVKVVKPVIHCYGHAHHGSGIYPTDDTMFVNAAILSEDYTLTKEPVVLDVDFDAGKH